MHHADGMMSPDRLRMAMVLLGGITQGELSRASGVSPTTISLFLNGKRKLRPALAARLVEGMERAFVRKGSRLDTAFFTDAEERTDASARRGWAESVTPATRHSHDPRNRLSRS